MDKEANADDRIELSMSIDTSVAVFKLVLASPTAQRSMDRNYFARVIIQRLDLQVAVF